MARVWQWISVVQIVNFCWMTEKFWGSVVFYILRTSRHYAPHSDVTWKEKYTPQKFKMHLCICTLGHALRHATPILIKSLGQWLSFKTIWAFLGVLEPKLQNYKISKKKFFIYYVIREIRDYCSAVINGQCLTTNLSCSDSEFWLGNFKSPGFFGFLITEGFMA